MGTHKERQTAFVLARKAGCFHGCGARHGIPVEIVRERGSLERAAAAEQVAIPPVPAQGIKVRYKQSNGGLLACACELAYTIFVEKLKAPRVAPVAPAAA